MRKLRLSKSSSEKITFELTRAYPIGCTLNSIYGVTGIICSTGRYNLYKARDRRTGALSLSGIDPRENLEGSTG